MTIQEERRGRNNSSRRHLLSSIRVEEQRLGDQDLVEDKKKKEVGGGVLKRRIGSNYRMNFEFLFISSTRFSYLLQIDNISRWIENGFNFNFILSVNL